MSRNDEEGLMDLLKWAGLIALIAVPVYMMIKMKKEQLSDSFLDDDSNIFAAELQD